MNTASNWVIIGRFGRPHGVKGLITVQSFTDPKENMLKYPDWHIKTRGQWQPLDVAHLEAGSKFFIAKVEGYTNRESVSSLTNCEIGIQQEALPDLDEGEYYWHQLVGMDVVNLAGKQLGQVKEIMPTGANDVLVVEGESRILIPYVPERVIVSVDPEKHCIQVDWDEVL